MQIKSIDVDYTETDNKNIQQFVTYFQKGCKETHTAELGMELEHFVVDGKEDSVAGYYGEMGIEALLERLSPYFPEKAVKDGHIIGLGNSKYAISIEPAAQLEVSIAPQKQIQDMERIYGEFQELIAPVLEEWGYRLAARGYCLKEKANELPLIPKKRYEYMNRYFEDIGIYGCCMMRGTASVQCAVDYNSEEDFVKTYQAAVALGPLLGLLTDNAVMFEGQPWKKHMVRAFIWEHVDKKRCGIVPGTFSPDFGFETYGRYLYQVPLIFVEKEHVADSGDCIGETVAEYVGNVALKELCHRKPMTSAQMEHVMSMVFPDVRLKQYIEIRVGDSMPIEYALSYAAFIKGLFQNRDELHQLYKQLEQYTQLGVMTEEEVTLGKEQLIEYGYEGVIYGKCAGYWLDKMMDMAKRQLPQIEKSYLQHMQKLIEGRKSVKDILE